MFPTCDVSLVKRSSSEKIKTKITSDKNASAPRFELGSNDETLAETGPSAQETKHLHRDMKI